MGIDIERNAHYTLASSRVSTLERDIHLALLWEHRVEVAPGWVLERSQSKQQVQGVLGWDLAEFFPRVNQCCCEGRESSFGAVSFPGSGSVFLAHQTK